MHPYSGTPLIAHERLLRAYTFLNSSHVVASSNKDQLSDVMRKLLEGGSQAAGLANMRTAIWQLRDQLNKEAVTKFQTLLKGWGL